MGSVLDMTVCNTFFKKHTPLTTYTSGLFKSQIDYITNQSMWGAVKVIAEEVAQQHQLLIYEIMICSVKEVKKLFVPKWKILRLNEDSTKVMFVNEFKRLTQVSGQKTGIEARMFI